MSDNDTALSGPLVDEMVRHADKHAVLTKLLADDWTALWDENARLKAELAKLRKQRADLLALCEHINHAVWPDPDAGHDTADAPRAIAELRQQRGDYIDQINALLKRQCINDECVMRSPVHVAEFADQYWHKRAEESAVKDG